MRGWCLKVAGWVCCGVMLTALAGCGNLFGPPPRPVPIETRESSPSSIYFVMPRKLDAELEGWARSAQNEANLSHIIFRMVGYKPEETEFPRESLSVTRALSDGATALLILPSDDPELPKAMADAQAKGIHLITLHKSVQMPPGSKPVSVIEVAPVEPLAQKIVETCLDELKKAGRTDKGSAVLVTDINKDFTSERRIKALKEAATKAGISKVVEVSIDGTSLKDGVKKVADVIDAQADIAILLADDAETLRLAGEARQSRLAQKDKSVITVGGFIDYTATRIPVYFPGVCCYAIGRYEQMAVLAIQKFQALMAGQSIPEHIINEAVFKRVEGETLDQNRDRLGTKPEVQPPMLIDRGNNSEKPAAPANTPVPKPKP